MGRLCRQCGLVVVRGAGVVVGLVGVTVLAAALLAGALGGVAGPALDADPQGDRRPAFYLGEAGVPFGPGAAPFLSSLRMCFWLLPSPRWGWHSPVRYWVRLVVEVRPQLRQNAVMSHRHMSCEWWMSAHWWPSATWTCSTSLLYR